MNQILMVENKKKRNKLDSGTVEIVKIVRFFSIILIIFGILFIGKGSNAIYKASKGKNTENMPTVRIYRINDTAKLKVSSGNVIENIIYSWNNSEETKIPVGDTYAEEDIILPMENSTLNISIEDETGRIVRYKKEFIIEGLDISQPTIEVIEESSNGNIKITATDETAISYITYKVNEEDEIRIDKSETEDKTMNYILKLPRGENKVIITAVDESGNIETLEKIIIISMRTAINLEIQNGKLIVIAEDPDGVKDIEINLNGVIYSAKDINQKKVNVPLDLVQGTNIIKVTVTNVNSLVTEGSKEFNYVQ